MFSAFQSSRHTTRIPVRMVAWIIMLIYLVGPFQLHVCTAACAQNDACCQPIEPVGCCSSEPAGQSASAPTGCAPDSDCCVELAFDPPIGVLQTLSSASLTLPAVTATAAYTLPRDAVKPVTWRPEIATWSSPPAYILFEILRR